MPGTALNWSSAKIPRGVEYALYAGVSVPAAGARLTLHTDGTPESVANPNAIHLGRSDEGAELLYRPSFEHATSDEFSAPYRSIIGAEEMRINASLKAVMDVNILDKLSVGGTKTTGAGFEETTFGGLATITTSSFALIFRNPEVAAKYCVWQIFKGLNDAGIVFRVQRTRDGSTPVSIVALTIDTRPAAQHLGSFWCQI